MTTGVDILRDAYQASCDKLHKILDGIAEPEFFWAPVAGSWTVHHRTSQPRGVETGSGEWVLDYDPSEPQPAPFTTIAWRTLHIASMNYLYWDYAFGTASLSFDLELPGNVAEATDWLFASHQPVQDVLAGLTEVELDKIAPTHWGQQWRVHRIFATLVNEQVHHGAEISLLRDLYRYRSSLRP